MIDNVKKYGKAWFKLLCLVLPIVMFVTSIITLISGDTETGRDFFVMGFLVHIGNIVSEIRDKT